jgi:hypothetical protein
MPQNFIEGKQAAIIDNATYLLNARVPLVPLNNYDATPTFSIFFRLGRHRTAAAGLHRFAVIIFVWPMNPTCDIK